MHVQDPRFRPRAMSLVDLGLSQSFRHHVETPPAFLPHLSQQWLIGGLSRRLGVWWP